MYWGGHWSLWIWHTGAALAVAILVAGTAIGGRLGTVLFANRGMAFLGVISYSLYLWHYPVLHWLNSIKTLAPVVSGSFFPAFLITFPLMVLVATLSYWTVERPFLKFRH